MTPEVFMGTRDRWDSRWKTVFDNLWRCTQPLESVLHTGVPTWVWLELGSDMSPAGSLKDVTSSLCMLRSRHVDSGRSPSPPH